MHSFAYPYHEFEGQLIDVSLNSDQEVTALSDGLVRKEVDTFELEPEPISGIYEGIWEQRRLVPPLPDSTRTD